MFEKSADGQLGNSDVIIDCSIKTMVKNSKTQSLDYKKCGMFPVCDRKSGSGSGKSGPFFRNPVRSGPVKI